MVLLKSNYITSFLLYYVKNITESIVTLKLYTYKIIKYK